MEKLNFQNPNSKRIEQGNSNMQGGNPELEIGNSKRRIAFSRLKRKILKHVWLVRIGIIAIAILGLIFFFFLLGQVLRSFRTDNYLSIVSNFILAPKSKIESFEGRTNILILGKSGKGFTAPDLTDTIIFASVSLTKPSLVLISLPRDIWIPSIRAKLNSAYFWGKEKQEKGGLILAKSLVEEIMAKPVHYGLVIDFSGFTKIIDALGGVEVNVERSFVDEKYPIPGKENDECGGDKEFKCRYETIRFIQGKQFMNGETALKFVRSRNAPGEEGTDLAREARQQKLIAAIKNKLFSPKIYLSPGKIIEIIKTSRQFIETDIDTSAGAILVRKFLAGRNKIKSLVLPEELLFHPSVSPRYDNQYVFIPEEGSWTKIQEWVSEQLLLKN